jgi:hypothetical protein
MSTVQLPVNAFLKFMTDRGLTMPQAISIATPLLKAGYNTEAKLATLNEVSLNKLHLNEDKHIKKTLLEIGKKVKKVSSSCLATETSGDGVQGKKRSRDSDMDFPLPLPSEGSSKDMVQDFTLPEMTNLEELQTKFVIVNRAPVMLAWAIVVCERLAFTREEALSIAQAYTELNAISKGSSLGILPSLPKDLSSQPYVEIMGRKVPVIGLQDGKWRGLVDGKQADPARAFGYIRKSFQQQLGAVIGGSRSLPRSLSGLILEQAPCDISPTASSLLTSIRKATAYTANSGRRQNDGLKSRSSGSKASSICGAF